MSTFKYTPLSQYDSNDFRSHFTFTGDDHNKPKNILNHRYSDDSVDIMASKQNCMDCVCTSLVTMFAYLVFIITLPISGFFAFKMVHQYERVIVYRLGRLCPVKGPGLVLVLPCIDRWHRVDLRMKAFNIPPSKVCTTDGCIVSIGGIIHFRIRNPLLMTLAVQDINHAIRDSALSDMTNLLSKKSFHEIKSKRQRLSYDLQIDINQSCKEWGAEVGRVELSDVTLLVAPKNEGPSPFMPMYGAPLPPEAPQNPFGGDALGGLAQFAQQIISHASSHNHVTSHALSHNHVTSHAPSHNHMEQAPVKPGPSVEELFARVKSGITPGLASEVGVSFEFHLEGAGTYFLDLRDPPGAVGEGKFPEGNPDVTLSLSLNTLQELMSGALSPTQAYMGNRLTIDGQLADARRLEKVFECL